METKRVAAFAQIALLCALGAMFIFFVFGKALGTSQPDSVHTYLMHLRGIGDIYVYPIIGLLWLATKVTFVGACIIVALLGLVTRDS